MTQMTDIMLDIETFGNSSKAVVLSISAVQFNLITGQIGKEFEVGLDIDQQLQCNREVSGSTLLWWFEQDKEAQKALLNIKREKVEDALNKLTTFIQEVRLDTEVKLKDLKVWGNGATFDNVIVKSLYDDFNIPYILPYWTDRDVRTLLELSKFNKYKVKFEGIKHNGIDDCKHQIKYCNMAYKQMLNFNK